MPKVFVAALVWGFSACAALAAVDKPDVRQLMRAAVAGDESARLQAIDTLGEQTEAAPEIVKTLSGQLQDASAMVRAHAAHALGQLGPAARPAIESLAPLLVDPDTNVRRATIRAWARIRPGVKVTVPLLTKLLLDADPSVRTSALKILVGLGRPAVPALMESLKHEKSTYWACLGLAELGPNAAEATPALAEVLQSDTRPEVRREAALALGSIGPAAVDAVPALMQALTDPESTVADGAAFALGQMGPTAKPADAELSKCLASPNPFLRTISAWALAKIEPRDKGRQQKAITLLAEALRSKEPRLRHAAVHGLIDLNPKADIILPALKQALDAADRESLEYALEALDSLGAPAVPVLIDALRHKPLRPAVASILGRKGPAAKQATAALAQIVTTDRSVLARSEALIALGDIGPDAAAAVPAAVVALKDPDQKVGYSACYALGKMGPAALSAKPDLQKKLKDNDPSIALAAAWALARIDPRCPETAPQAVPVLIQGLSDSEPRVRLEAAIALRCLGPVAKEAVPALKKALHDKDALVRDMAGQALTAIGG